MLDFSFSHSLSIIVITCIVSLLAWNNHQILNRCIFYPPAVGKGQWDRFITYGFIHADGMHLLFNMITLFFFGRFIEQFYRQYAFDMGFALFYLGGLVFSILPSYLQHRHDRNYLSLGASGAVSAVLFAFVLFRPWSLIFVFFIPMPAIIFAALYVGYSIWAQHRGQTQINHSAHLYGALYGILVTLMLEPQIFWLFLSQLFNPHF